MDKDIREVLFDEDRIRDRIRELGEEITNRYRGTDLVLMALLKGGVVFISDLMRTIPIHLDIDFIVSSSYGNSTESSGEVKLKVFPELDFRKKSLLVLDDILDTGRTLHRVVSELRRRGAEDVATCVLLDKKVRRAIDIQADFVGFDVDDHFVVGYGLDFADRYRNLPYIGVLREECYRSSEQEA